jgi:hypothetical protein
MRSRIIGVRFQLFELRLGGVGRDWYLDFLLGLRVEAGVCARRRSNFLLLRQEKVTKEKATLLAATPARSAGATCGGTLAGCAVELAARLRRSAQTATASQLTMHARTSAHATPQVLRRRRIQKGWGNQTATRAIAALGLTSRAQAPRAAQTRPSAAMARVAVLAVGLRPFWMRLGRAGCGAAGVPQDTPASWSSLPQLFERSAIARSEFCGTPRARAPQVARSEAEGRRKQGRLSFGIFSLATQRKDARPPGRDPVSALNQSKKFPSKQLESDPNCLRKLSKIIAASAYPISARAQKHHKFGGRVQP